MFEFLKPLSRGAATLAVLAGASVSPMIAGAQSTGVNVAQASEPAADAQVVARDLATGKLRPATAAEAQALHSHRASLRSASAQMQPHSHWSGAQGTRLTEESMTYSLIMKQADGKLVEICVEGAETAAKAVSTSPVVKSAVLPTE